MVHGRKRQITLRPHKQLPGFSAGGMGKNKDYAVEVNAFNDFVLIGVHKTKTDYFSIEYFITYFDELARDCVKIIEKETKARERKRTIETKKGK